MKKTIILLFLLTLTGQIFAQGMYFNYKALISDNNNAPIANQTIDVRFTIYDENPATSGIQIFQETHSVTTDNNGIITLNIGSQDEMNWTSIDWTYPYNYLKVEFDTGSGFEEISTTTFEFMPYAKFSLKAESVNHVDFNQLTNIPAGLSDGDDNTQLSEAQVDDYVANNGYIITEVDGDTTNELQTISKTGSTVTLSDGGGSFTDDNTQLTETQVDDYVANNGYATELDDLSDAKTDGASVFIGEGAGQNDQGDNYNVAIGKNALFTNTTGIQNTANGSYALYSNTTGIYNTAIGSQSLISNTKGNYNTANGYQSLYFNTEGNYNTAIGFGAGLNNQTGNKNIFLGYNAGYNETGSDKLYIENSSSTTPLIGGDFATDEVIINGTLQITGGTPEAGKVLTSDANGKGSWETPVDNDTQLTETEVDDYVANNGYLTAETLPDQTDDDFFEVGTTTQPNSISDAIYHTGNIVIGTNTGESFNTLTVKKTTTGTDELKTIYTEISGDGTGDHFGSYHKLIGTQAANFYGTYNSMNSLGNGLVYGTFNVFTASGDGNKYGIKSQFASNTNDTGKHFGVYNDMYGSSSNLKYGVYTIIYNSGDGDHYGTHNILFGTGSGNKYGTHNSIDPAAGGTHYAVYGDAQKSGSYAGYFLGTVSIKDGTEGLGKVFTSDAYGRGSWQTPASVGATELNDLSDAKTGGESVFIGEGAGQNDDGTHANTAIGTKTLYTNTTGYHNTANGYKALYSNTEGESNTANGYSALYYNTEGDYNTANGSYALSSNTTGYLNTANGYQTLHSNTEGNLNTANGSSALNSNTEGDYNTANGSYALYLNTEGNYNTVIGYSAGRSNQTGNGNIFLGYKAGYNETGSDKLYIENSSSTTPLIGGDFATDEVTVNGNLFTINNVGADADLKINASGSNNPGVHYFLDDVYKTSTGYNVSEDAYFVYHGGNVFFKNGNILPDAHSTYY